MSKVDETVRSYATADRPRAIAAFAISLSYHLPTSLEEWLEKSVGEDRSLTSGLAYTVELRVLDKIKLPLATHCRNSTNRLELKLPQRILGQLQALGLAAPTEGRIIDWLGIDAQQIRSLSSKLLREWRSGTGYNLSKRYLSLQSSIVCQLVTGDLLFNYLIFRNTNDKPPNSMYYQTMAVDKVRCGWECIQSYLSGDSSETKASWLKQQYLRFKPDIPYDELEFIGQSLKERHIRSFVSELKTRTRTVLKSEKDPIRVHNAYVDYVVSLLMWGLALRPVQDPIPYKYWLNLNEKIALIQDKVTNDGTAYRLGPLADICVEILSAYQRHLSNLSDRLSRNKDARIRNTSQVIRDMFDSSPKRKPTIPYLFYLSEDGYSTRAISRATIEKLWQSILPIPANYGRKFIYDKLIQAGVEDIEIRSILGHQSAAGTIFSQHSVEPIKDSLSRLAIKIDQALRSCEWQVIEGIKPYARPIAQKKMLNPLYSDDIHEDGLLGPDRRLRARKEKDRKAEAGLKEIIESYEIAANMLPGKLSTSKGWSGPIAYEIISIIDEQAEYATSESRKREISRIRMVLYRKIRKLAKDDRQFRDLIYETPFGARERFPISERRFTDYQVAKQLQRRFVDHFNMKSKKQSHNQSHANQILAELVVSTALFSKIADPALLRDVPTLVFDTARHEEYCIWTVTNTLATIDTPTFRWISDPISSLLTNRYLKHRKNARASGDISADIVALLSAIAPYKHTQKATPYVYLGSMADALSCMESIPAWRNTTKSIGLNRRLTNQSFAMYLCGKSLPLHPSKSPPLNSMPELPNTLAAYKLMNRLLREIPPIVKSYPNNEELINLRKRLKEESGYFQHQHQIVKALYYWIIDVCDNGLKKATTPSISTIQRYFSHIGRPLIRLVGARELKTISYAEFMGLYEHIVQEENLGTKKNRMLTAFKQFHTFMSADPVWEVQDIDWGDIEVVHPQEISCTASYISIDDYRKILDFYIERIDIHSESSIEKPALLLLFRRFGLRRTEATSLPRNALLFDFANGEFWIRKRKRTKTKHSIRQVFMAGDVSENELRLMRLLSKRDKILDRVGAGSNSLFHINDPNDVYFDQLLTGIKHDLRCICADSRITIHTLRHSWATDRVREIFETRANGEHKKNDFYSDIWSITSSLGHSDSKTLFRTYFNAIEIITYKHQRRGFDKLNAVELSYLCEKPYITIRKQIVEGRFDLELNLHAINELKLIAIETDLRETEQTPHSPLTIPHYFQALNYPHFLQHDQDAYQVIIDKARYIESQVGLDVLSNHSAGMNDNRTLMLSDRMTNKLLTDLYVADNVLRRADEKTILEIDFAINHWLIYYSPTSPKAILFNDYSETLQFLTAIAGLSPKSFTFEFRYAEIDYNKSMHNYQYNEILFSIQKSGKPNRRGMKTYNLALVPKSKKGKTLRNNIFDIYMLMLASYRHMRSTNT